MREEMVIRARIHHQISEYGNQRYDNTEMRNAN